MMVGVTGFEPATSASRRQRSTKLSYTPRQASLVAPADDKISEFRECLAVR